MAESPTFALTLSNLEFFDIKKDRIAIIEENKPQTALRDKRDYHPVLANEI